MLQQISLADFPKLVHEQTLNIIDPVILQLVRFFEKNDQRNQYQLITQGTEGELTSYVSVDDIKTYNLYGISFDTQRVTTLRKNVLLVLHDDDVVSVDAVKGAFDRTVPKAFDGTVAVVLALSYLDDSEGELLDTIDLIKSVIPEALFLNVSFTVEYETEGLLNPSRSDQLHYVDVSDLVADSRPRNVQLGFDIKKLFELRSTLVTMAKEDPLIVFRVEKLAHSMECIFTAIAAECTLTHRLRFEFVARDYIHYIRFARRLNERTYMYASEYLEGLRNPIDVAFDCDTSRGCGYVYVLDHSELYESGSSGDTLGDPVISMVALPFDLDEKCITDNTIVQADFSLSSIEILRLEDLYELGNDDQMVAKAGLAKLGTVIREFEAELINEKNLIGNETLHCSNTLLFKFNNKVFLGWIADIRCNFPYYVYPIATGYRPFSTVLTLAEYERLLDMKYIDDGQEVMMRLIQQGAVGGSTWSRKTFRASSAFFLSGMPRNTQIIPKDCGVTLEQVGMYEWASANVRVGKSGFIFDSLTHEAMRKKQYLTYFGGPNPMSTRSITLAPEDWR